MLTMQGMKLFRHTAESSSIKMIQRAKRGTAVASGGLWREHIYTNGRRLTAPLPIQSRQTLTRLTAGSDGLS